LFSIRYRLSFFDLVCYNPSIEEVMPMQDITDVRAIGQRVRNARKARGLSMDSLAHMTGLSPSFVGNIERGSKVASVETLARICLALDADLHAIVFGSPSGVDPDRCLRQALAALLEQYP
jgi:transcriptional regulator with XRE-family HTH domain